MSKQLRKKYSKEFKHEAVGLVVDQGYSKTEAGRSLGINPDLIRCNGLIILEGSIAYNPPQN